MTSSTPTNRRAKLSLPIGLGAAGVVAGAVLAGSLVAHAAATPTPGPHAAGPQRNEAPVTDTSVVAKVKAAVEAKYPGATVAKVESTDTGYEAHVTKADGTKLHVDLSKAFAVTGAHEGRRGGPGRHGGPGRNETPVTDTAVVNKVKAAVLAKYAGATLDKVESTDTGYEAHVTTKAGARLYVDLSKTFAITAAHEGRGGPGGRRGPHGRSNTDPAHEAAESPEHAAEEKADDANAGTTTNG